MNWFQLKMKVKGAKPPVWRRGFVPEGITFTQLAWILQELLDCEKTEAYEFEFYRKAIVCEWKEGVNFRKNFFCSYYSASDTFVNELLSSEKWFTFRAQKDAGQTAEYRIEIEKKASEVSERRKEGNVPIVSPVISKEVGFQCSWSDSLEKNRILREQYQISEGPADYRSYQEIQKGWQAGKSGIQVCAEPKNRTEHSQPSMPELLNQLTEAGGLQSEDLLKGILGNHLGEKPKQPEKDQESREPLVKDMLFAYEKADLVEMAKELHLHYSKLKKEDLAEKIANEILRPSVMQERLLLLEDREIAAFEAAMKRKCFYPTDAEWEDLDAAVNLAYIAYFRDECLEVPKEVILAYQAANTPEFQRERKKINWMMECLDIFGFLYAVAPVEILCNIYCTKKEFACSREEVLKIFQKIPEEMNPCTLTDDKIALTVLMKKKLYRKIERIQRDVDYYIPAEAEVHDYYQKGYFSEEPAYRKLKQFCEREFHYNMEEREKLCAYIYQEFAKGKMFSKVIEGLTKQGMVFSSDRQVENFVALMTDASNHTRMFELKGHMPAEMSAMLAGTDYFNPKIVPMQRNSAGPAEAKEKKVYPNDPCPCGSGKKYKKCCGRKQGQ